MKSFDTDRNMKLTSSAFENNGRIPGKYTCDGQELSPPLKIENSPVLAKSFVLIMDDPDIPDFVKEKFRIHVWDHWVLFNINPTVKEIKEGQNPGIKGKNTAHRLGYASPCPPDREHRYFFKLYALDTLLQLKEGSTKIQVEEAMQGHIIAKAELVGRYERTK